MVRCDRVGHRSGEVLLWRLLHIPSISRSMMHPSSHTSPHDGACIANQTAVGTALSRAQLAWGPESCSAMCSMHTRRPNEPLNEPRTYPKVAAMLQCQSAYISVISLLTGMWLWRPKIASPGRDYFYVTIHTGTTRASSRPGYSRMPLPPLRREREWCSDVSVAVLRGFLVRL